MHCKSKLREDLNLQHGNLNNNLNVIFTSTGFNIRELIQVFIPFCNLIHALSKSIRQLGQMLLKKKLFLPASDFTESTEEIKKYQKRDRNIPAITIDIGHWFYKIEKRKKYRLPLTYSFNSSRHFFSIKDLTSKVTRDIL